MNSLKEEIQQYRNRYKIKKNLAWWTTRVDAPIYAKLQYIVDDITFFKHQILRKIRDEYKTLPNVPN
jgi:hypothetical protein